MSLPAIWVNNYVLLYISSENPDVTSGMKLEPNLGDKNNGVYAIVVYTDDLHFNYGVI